MTIDTAAQAAGLLQVHIQTVYANAHRLGGVRVGRRWRFTDIGIG